MAQPSTKTRRLILRALGETLPSPPEDRPVWVHALSAGEVAAAQPLVSSLASVMPDIPVVLSVTTAVGREVAEERLGKKTAGIFYLPLDFPLAVARAIRRINPRVFVLVETDIWPVILLMLKKKRIPSVLVNARLSPSSADRYAAFGPLVRPVLKMFTRILAKSKEDAKRFLMAGLDPSVVEAAGNLKFHIEPPEDPGAEAARFKEAFGLERGRTVWVAGSTHPGEEGPLISVYSRLLEHWPGLFLIIAPRHPARAGEVAAAARDAGLAPLLRSKTLDTQGRGPKEVGILDTMGELASLYSLASLAFIGGSLVPFGGHNPLEAAVRGVPVVFGPHMFNFTDEAHALAAGGGGYRVAGEEKLESLLSSWLAVPELRLWAGEKARGAVEAHQGALQRCLHVIKSLI